MMGLGFTKCGPTSGPRLSYRVVRHGRLDRTQRRKEVKARVSVVVRRDRQVHRLCGSWDDVRANERGAHGWLRQQRVSIRSPRKFTPAWQGVAGAVEISSKEDADGGDRSGGRYEESASPIV